MMSKIRVGIIGAGVVARLHAEAYRTWADDCRVLATADVLPERAQEMAGVTGAGHWYADYQELLDRSDIDLVSICTPPFTHASAAIASLRAGKHVICEKPMAASLQECDAMIEAARESGKELTVSFQNRFSPDFWRAHRLIEDGRLGRLVFGKAETLWYRGANYYDVSWRGSWETECGGATNNQGVHSVDALLWMMGDPVSVYAEMDALVHDIEVEDISIAIVRFANGALGQITSSVDCHQHSTRLEIAGERAAVSSPWSLTARIPNEKGSPMDNQALMDELATFAAETETPATEGHTALVGDMLRAIRTGGRPLIDGVEGRRSVELVTGLYKSASVGARVEFPISPDDPFYTVEGFQANVKRHLLKRPE